MGWRWGDRQKVKVGSEGSPGPSGCDKEGVRKIHRTLKDEGVKGEGVGPAPRILV